MNAEKLIANTLSVLVATAAISASAQLVIILPSEVSVAPITGQSLAVLMTASLLGWKNGGLSVLLYLILGVLGVPVFSEFTSGWEAFTGPSLGYFIGFLIATIVIGVIAAKQANTFSNFFLQMTIGTVIILICGGIGLFRFLEFSGILQKGILPFLPGTLVKMLVGAVFLSVYYKIKLLLKPV